MPVLPVGPGSGGTRMRQGGPPMIESLWSYATNRRRSCTFSIHCLTNSKSICSNNVSFFIDPANLSSAFHPTPNYLQRGFKPMQDLLALKETAPLTTKPPGPHHLDQIASWDEYVCFFHRNWCVTFEEIEVIFFKT